MPTSELLSVAILRSRFLYLNASPIRAAVPRLFSRRTGRQNGRETAWRKRRWARLEMLSIRPVDRRYYQPLNYEYFVAAFELAERDRGYGASAAGAACAEAGPKNV